jgi:hypothetical protein
LYYRFDDHPKEDYWFKLADFLMNVGLTILSTVLIGGGLGGIFNFIFEEEKEARLAAKAAADEKVEHIAKARQFRREIKQRLQEVYDDVQLARILIKSHRSGRTYGEQIRTRIMPSYIALTDIKQQLVAVSNEGLVTYMAELQLSLTYMSAYLSTLIEEFAEHYLRISNLQNYQDALDNRLRDVYTEVVEQTDPPPSATDPKVSFLENTDTHFAQQSVPERIEMVWEALSKLDYVRDFIRELRDEQGLTSLYQTHFLDHHFHSFRILRPKGSRTNKKLCERPDFQRYLQVLEELQAKKDGDQPITRADSLTRIIMQESLQFDFDTKQRAK